MARGRMISTTIAEDVAFNSMSVDAQFLFMRTIPHLDRDGLVVGHPVLLLSKIAPLLPGYTEKMATIVREWSDNGFVICYQDGKRDVIFFVNFRKHQTGMRYEKEAPSQFAPPPMWKRTGHGLVSPDRDNTSGQDTEADCGEYTQGADLVRTNCAVSEKKGRVEVEVEVEDQDQGTIEGVLRASEPPPPTLQDTLNAAVDELERRQTLKLMASWEKGSQKTKQARVRLSPSQEAIIRSQAPTTEIPEVRPAGPLPPTVNPNRVIAMPDGSKIIIEELVWTQMMGVMLAGLGKKALADAGVARARSETAYTLEVLCKMSDSFRSKEGIQELFASWTRARPDYPVPKSEWLEEHASLYLSGKVRYPDQSAPKKQGVLANVDPNFTIQQYTGVPDYSDPCWDNIQF